MLSFEDTMLCITECSACITVIAVRTLCRFLKNEVQYLFQPDLSRPSSFFLYDDDNSSECVKCVCVCVFNVPLSNRSFWGR